MAEWKRTDAQGGPADRVIGGSRVKRLRQGLGPKDWLIWRGKIKNLSGDEHMLGGR